MRESARKERGMKDFLIAFMLGGVPMLTGIYVLFFGYPSIFVSIVIIVGTMLLMWKAVSSC